MRCLLCSVLSAECVRGGSAHKLTRGFFRAGTFFPGSLLTACCCCCRYLFAVIALNMVNDANLIVVILPVIIVVIVVKVLAKDDGAVVGVALSANIIAATSS